MPLISLCKLISSSTKGVTARPFRCTLECSHSRRRHRVTRLEHYHSVVISERVLTCSCIACVSDRSSVSFPVTLSFRTLKKWRRARYRRSLTQRFVVLNIRHQNLSQLSFLFFFRTLVVLHRIVRAAADIGRQKLRRSVLRCRRFILRVDLILL